MIGRSILVASAVFLFAAGAAGLFGADYVAAKIVRGSLASETFVQIGSASLLGFSLLNWMSRGNVIGGIYLRPLTLANLMLFGVSALSLSRSVFAGDLPLFAILPAVLSGLLATAFGWLAFAFQPLR